MNPPATAESSRRPLERTIVFSARLLRSQPNIPPSPGGEGRGEGEPLTDSAAPFEVQRNTFEICAPSDRCFWPALILTFSAEARPAPGEGIMQGHASRNRQLTIY